VPKIILKIYKVPLLISATLFIVLLALRVEREPVNIALLFLGVFLGTFLLDLDYFLHAYFLEPLSDFSKDLQGYVKHRDFTGAFTYVHFHKNEVPEKILNSALFQIVFGALMVFVLASSADLLMKALVLSAFANSIYRMIETYFEGNIAAWFWAIKMPTTREAFLGYTVIMVAVFLFCLSLI
jgi:hypothetical protein